MEIWYRGFDTSKMIPMDSIFDVYFEWFGARGLWDRWWSFLCEGEMGYIWEKLRGNDGKDWRYSIRDLIDPRGHPVTAYLVGTLMDSKQGDCEICGKVFCWGAKWVIVERILNENDGKEWRYEDSTYLQCIGWLLQRI